MSTRIVYRNFTYSKCVLRPLVCGESVLHSGTVMKLQTFPLCAYLYLMAAYGVQASQQGVYKSPRVPEEAHFVESFDSGPLERRWVVSKAPKEHDRNSPKYEGQWALEKPDNQASSGNWGLVMKSPGQYHAIAAPLRTVFHFRDKPLILQYEVLFQNRAECGGAYIKLLSHTPQLQLSQFNSSTPFSIMFGPDKCGSNQKVHFIFQHRNPLTGQYQEKHARQPDNDLSKYFTDHQAHLYTLRLYPDNIYEILIDQSLISKGSLLEDVDPPVNPPREIPDPDDTKPADWDDRRRIPDPKAAKPSDWDDKAPKHIPDSTVPKPPGWLEDVEPFILDPKAQRPDDWDEEMDGEWELPRVPNPACAQVPGCGPWVPPIIHNPAYKGKWGPPLIDNPHYQGEWRPQMIPNPWYFEDKAPFQMTAVAAVGLELWSLTGGVLFDNILLCSDFSVAQRWTDNTWGPRKTPGPVMQLLLAAQEHPWLWGVYVFTFGLPAILFISFMWPDKRFGPMNQDYYYKKCDAPQPDSLHDLETMPNQEAYGAVKKTELRKREASYPRKQKF
ncbi:calnexin-like [Arapaima gigas]